MPAKRRVDKPWGHEIIWAQTDRYVGKVLVIREGHQLSYQYHREKEETFFLAEGMMELEFEEGGVRKTRRMAKGDSFHIPPGMCHRMRAIEDCEVFEVSTPHLDDVVRLEDKYGRA